MAVRERTIGISAEELVEALHAVTNRRKRLYCGIAQEDKQMEAIVKDHGHQSLALNPSSRNLVEVLG